MAIWKIKNVFFTNKTTILRGVFCPSVNATSGKKNVNMQVIVTKTQDAIHCLLGFEFDAYEQYWLRPPSFCSVCSLMCSQCLVVWRCLLIFMCSSSAHSNGIFCSRRPVLKWRANFCSGPKSFNSIRRVFFAYLMNKCRAN